MPVSILTLNKKWVINYGAGTGKINMQKPVPILENKEHKQPALILEYNPNIKLIWTFNFFNRTF